MYMIKWYIVIMFMYYFNSFASYRSHIADIDRQNQSVALESVTLHGSNEVTEVDCDYNYVHNVYLYVCTVTTEECTYNTL